MAPFDAIVVGAGPAGVMAARSLAGKRVLILDVGRQPDSLPDLAGDLYSLRQSQPDLFDLLIGKDFDSLHNLHNEPLSLKLKAPLMRYIVDDARSLAPVRSQNFNATMSFAAGGLANAWGAGVYRFTARDLEGFPVGKPELEPFYDELTEHMGVSGANDDLTPSFGNDPALQPPIELSRFASDLQTGYQRKRALFARLGVSIGRTRLAVLTRPHRGRPPYNYGNFEFFRPHDPSVYNPVYTLRELIRAGHVRYEPQHLVLRFAQSADDVTVTTRNLQTGAHEVFESRTLILAAGALNSAKLVLESNNDHETRLPLLDNPMTCLPLFRPNRIGQALDTYDSSLGQLILIHEFQGTVLQGSVYGTAGPLRSDILFELPFSITANLAWLRRTAAATGLLMMFYPADPHPDNYLQLATDGALELRCGQPVTKGPARGVGEKALIPALRKIGFYTAAALCQYPPMGSGIHYAGTLPMREKPGRYELYPDGRLHGSQNIYVVDGACFPRLPAKNLTLTIMANAMRIASRLRHRIL